MVTHRMVQSTALFVCAAIVLSLPLPGVLAQQAGAQIDPHAIDDYLRSEMQELQIPGMAAVIVSGGQVVYTRGLGVADPSGRAVTPQTPMLLGSVSKGLTALAVMQLVEAGEIDLDASVQRYVPWLSQAGSPRRAQPGVDNAILDIPPSPIFRHAFQTVVQRIEHSFKHQLLHKLPLLPIPRDLVFRFLCPYYTISRFAHFLMDI